MSAADAPRPTPRASEEPMEMESQMIPLEAIERAGWVRPGFADAVIIYATGIGRRLTASEFADWLARWSPVPPASAPTPSATWTCRVCHKSGDAANRARAEKQHVIVSPYCSGLPEWISVPPASAPAATPEPERFDLAEQLNDLVNATQDGDEDRAERAQDAIVEAFARVTARPTGEEADERVRKAAERLAAFDKAPAYSEAHRKASEALHFMAVSDIRYLLNLVAALAALRDDMEYAAGECLVPMPEPGTDMGRLLSANVLLRRERDDANAALAALRARVEELEQDRTGADGTLTVSQAIDGVVDIFPSADRQALNCLAELLTKPPAASVVQERDDANAALAALRARVEEADEQTRAAWRAYDITFERREQFAREIQVADLLFGYFADWLDWGTLTIRRQREGEEPVTADLVVGPDETFRDALLRQALADGTPEFTAKLRAALAPHQTTGDEHD